MGLISRIADERRRHITGHATPHLDDDDEEIVCWVRIRRPEGKGEGFAFLTGRRFIVHWTRDGDSGTLRWDQVEAWGVAKDEKANEPLLGVEAAEESFYIQIQVTTSKMAEEVKRFLDLFSEFAPWPRRNLEHADEVKEFQAGKHTEVTPTKRNVHQLVKRIVITFLGVLLVLGGALITPLPGPWSLPIVLGGLAVLSNEYDWAKDALDWAKKKSKQVAGKFRKRKSSDPA